MAERRSAGRSFVSGTPETLGEGEDRDHRVPVASQHEARDIARGDPQRVRDEPTEAGRVERPRFAEDPGARESRDLPEPVGHHVHRVRHDHDGRVRGPRPDRLGVALHDRRRSWRGGRSGSSRVSGRDPRSRPRRPRPRIASSDVEPGDPGGELEDRGRLLDVERLPLGQSVHDVDEDDLARDVHLGQSLGEGSADVPAPSTTTLPRPVMCASPFAPTRPDP